MLNSKSFVRRCAIAAIVGATVISGAHRTIALLPASSSSFAWADDETTYYDNGENFLGQKKYAEAEAEFKKSIEYEPRYKEAWQALADTLKAEGKADQAAAIQKIADGITAVRQGPKPPLTDEQKAALTGIGAAASGGSSGMGGMVSGLKDTGKAPTNDAPPATPQPPADQAKAAQDGEFDDVHFVTPDAKSWKPQVTGNNLVFSVDLPPPDFCTLTIFASKDLDGDAAAFKTAFDAAVNTDLKAKKTVAVENDYGGDQVSSTPDGADIITHRLYCNAEAFHTCHLFVGIHVKGRFELMAFQSSGDETFNMYIKDASKFFSNLNIVYDHKAK